MNENEQRFNFFSACLMLAILASLGTATLIDLFNGPGNPREERIARTPDAPISVAAAKSFLGDARFYLGRRYALKNQFKTLQAKTLKSLFGRSSAPQVMYGSEDWLFLTDKHALASSMGAEGFQVQELEAWNTFFSEIAFDIGRPVAIVLAPNKHSVYPEKLPDWMHEKQVGDLRREAFLAAAATSGFPITDLVDFFSKARKSDPDLGLYHHTDSHWTELGATLALETSLNRQIEKTWQQVHTHGGDLARLLGLREHYQEVQPKLGGPNEIRCETIEGQEYLPVIFDPLPRKRFKCSAANKADGRVLVFMDSFGMSTVPFFSRSFSEAHFVWETKFNKDLIARLDPDLVVMVIVERALQRISPDALHK